VSDLTPEDVQEILRLIDESGYDELELETPRFSLRFRRAGAALPAPQERDSESIDVVAPMVGIFYRSPAPDAPPFVEVGSPVEEGTQVGVLEAMKLMNAVSAGARGTIVEVCVENAAPVQYGDVLFRVQPR
jgi:acetyl-CoA carboxylase biotin carboxyl carrier protein